MYDHARTGFTLYFELIPYALGILAAFSVSVVAAVLLVTGVDTLIGTVQNRYRTHRARRTWARSGRTTPR